MLLIPSTPSSVELFNDLIISKISVISTGKSKLKFVNSVKLVENETFSIFLFISFPMLEKYSFACSASNWQSLFFFSLSSRNLLTYAKNSFFLCLSSLSILTLLTLFEYPLWVSSSNFERFCSVYCQPKINTTEVLCIFCLLRTRGF